MDPVKLHRESIVIDMHCDTLLDVMAGRRSLLERSDQGQIDLPRLQEGGVTAQLFALFVPDAHAMHGATAFALRALDHLYQAIEQADGRLILARTAQDIETAHKAGQVAAIVGMEGAEPLDGSLELLHIFYRLGLRVLGLTWNRRNAAADGLDFARTGGRLTPFGVSLVERCNALGIVLDVAHLSPAGVQDVLEISRLPVIASHANARALCDFPRNLTDEQLQAIAEKGGVIGVTTVPDFITRDSAGATLDRFLDHIDYMIRLIGPDHVSLGSDFDGYRAQPPEGLTSIADFPNITSGLLARGHSPETVRKVLGENWLRVFRQVWT